jgi:Protein of unknown function (DUF2959)
MKMNVQTGLSVVAWLPLAFSGIWLAGCASTGYEKSQAAGWSLQAASDEVKAERRALDAATAALNNLVNTPPGDLVEGYRRFATAVDDLSYTVGRNEAARRRVIQASTAYLQNWDKQLAEMNFDAVRNQSAARKADVAGHFEAVNRRYQEAQDAITPVLDYFRDIRKALSTDLTLGGLEAMKPAANNAASNAGKVQGALENLATELANSGTKLSTLAVHENGNQRQ